MMTTKDIHIVKDSQNVNHNLRFWPLNIYNKQILMSHKLPKVHYPKIFPLIQPSNTLLTIN